jgi:hypothetical protein
MICTWRIQVDEAPLSNNNGGNGSRRHWAVAHGEKKRWQQLYTVELAQIHRVPTGMEACHLTAHVRWAHVPKWGKRQNRRDVENYRASISKPFADTLVRGLWLADDTSEFFTFGELTFEEGVDLGPLGLKAQVILQLAAQYPDVD